MPSWHANNFVVTKASRPQIIFMNDGIWTLLIKSLYSRQQCNPTFKIFCPIRIFSSRKYVDMGGLGVCHEHKLSSNYHALKSNVGKLDNFINTSPTGWCMPCKLHVFIACFLWSRAWAWCSSCWREARMLEQGWKHSDSAYLPWTITIPNHLWNISTFFDDLTLIWWYFHELASACPISTVGGAHFPISCVF